MKILKIFGVLLLFLSVEGNRLGLGAEPAFYESLSVQGAAGSEDISDRDYVIRTRQLIALSQKSIDAVFDVLAISDAANDPVSLLLRDLVDAAKRGVRVRLFLNTYSDSEKYSGSLFLREDKLEELENQGIRILFISPSYAVYDRMLIVDKEKVLEGGLPWRRDALEQSLGAATLIHSAVLAQKKVNRLELLPLWNVQIEKARRSDGEVPVPLFLLQDVKYFPAMVRQDDGDALRIYLALLQIYYAAHAPEFNVAFSELIQRIPADRFFEKGAAVYQVIQTLKRLQDEYGLIQIAEENPETMKISLQLPGEVSPVIGVFPAFFSEGFAKDLSPRALFAYLIILYRVQQSGQSPVWVGSGRNIEQDFPLPFPDFSLGIQELRKVNLIEIYPFSLRQGAGYDGPEVQESRYLVNAIPAISERLAAWHRMREDFGDDAVEKAKRAADILGEPEDPKVVTTYLDLLKTYDYEDIISLTQHVAAKPMQSTPAMLDYLQTLLKNETSENTGLGVV